MTYNSPLGPTAWSDESFQEKESAGFYIMAAAVIEPDAAQRAREAMLDLRGAGHGKRHHKLHWTEMDHRQRAEASRTIAALGGLHLVAIGSPVPPRRQERARAKCLSELVAQLHDFKVDCLYLEAREQVLNRRDVRTVTNARHALPKGSTLRIEHVHGGSEPLLWVADVVAGACRFEQLGQGEYRAALGDDVLDFEVVTGC
ncbi:hypothetical protein [Kitasatospora purpeofusca]|uniref:hypothetical protein n=1 Tax=Kitasatospora purpeofusca TaxID=67352 RepID=UPI00381BAC6D